MPEYEVNHMPEYEVSDAKKNAEKTTKAMSPATTRSTAGPGFDFEDHVAAWLLLKALHGQELPGVKGSVTRLQMQVEALGWHLDDILFTTDAGRGRPAPPGDISQE
jgi:hypothetical protein